MRNEKRLSAQLGSVETVSVRFEFILSVVEKQNGADLPHKQELCGPSNKTTVQVSPLITLVVALQTTKHALNL